MDYRNIVGIDVCSIGHRIHRSFSLATEKSIVSPEAESRAPELLLEAAWSVFVGQKVGPVGFKTTVHSRCIMMYPSSLDVS
jgi:hypothetical protein